MPRRLFPGLESFPDAATSDIRPTLLRELTDLYVQKPSHTPDEERIFIELALRLIDHVDAAERARIGLRLATYPKAPVAVMRRLAALDPMPFAPPPHASPSDQPEQALPRIVMEPSLDEDLSEAFFNATSEARRLILLHLDVSPIARAPVSSVGDLAHRLEQSALARRPDEFAELLEQALHISGADARRIAEDASGEAIVAAAKALALPDHVLQRILLFLNPAIGHAVEKYFALTRLYDEISEDAARRMVTIWRMIHARASRQATHQPQLRDDWMPRARDFASHEIRRSDRQPRPDGDQARRLNGKTET